MRIASDLKAQWQGGEQADLLTDDLMLSRDYGGLNIQDAELRLWLPDQAKIALSEVCDSLGVSITVYLTEFFATYLYGLHEVMRMRQRAIGIYEPEVSGRPVTESTDADAPRDELGPEYDDPVPEMGKNIFSLKIFLPYKIKGGLQHRANKAKVPLGRFARSMICAHLFGRDIGPNKLLRP